MALKEVELRISETDVPSDVADFVAEANQRIDQFIGNHCDSPILSFVPGDFLAVYRVLKHIVQNHLAPGRAFCEWGAGFGVVSDLASMLQLDSCGIEIENDLLEAARQLADDYGVKVAFAQGSFVPDGGDHYSDTLDDLSWLNLTGSSAYCELGMQPEDFDIIYVYPWPGEIRFMEDLFDQYAAVGSLLISYHGASELKVFRRVA